MSNDPTMTEIREVVERFIASWNEPDAARRAAVVRETFAADAQYCNANEQFVGLDRCVTAVTQAYESFVPSGHVFVAQGDPLSHHDAVTFRWRMSPTAGGDPVATGQMFAVINQNDKIHLLYQFLDQ
jgi:hypothetical protein